MSKSHTGVQYYGIEITAATWLSGHGEATRVTVFTQEGGKYIVFKLYEHI